MILSAAHTGRQFNMGVKFLGCNTEGGRSLLFSSTPLDSSATYDSFDS